MTESEALRNPLAIAEDRSRLLMGMRGYRLHDKALWYIVNDDPEDFQETRIDDWTGTHEEAWWQLIRHDFPTSSFVVCPGCGDGQSDFGGLCPFCAREASEWEKAGENR